MGNKDKNQSSEDAVQLAVHEQRLDVLEYDMKNIQEQLDTQFEKTNAKIDGALLKIGIGIGILMAVSWMLK